MSRIHDFPTTRWSVVLRAQAQDEPLRREALTDLYLAYWHPLYAYARRAGRSPEAARDAVQTFFLKLVETNFVRAADPARGRFRSFLSTVFKRFLKDEYQKDTAVKRGGTALHVDLAKAEAQFARCVSLDAPEAAFDRDWAHAVVQHALDSLLCEWKANGKLDVFETLRDFLPGGQPKRNLREVADATGMTETAVKVAIHRLRRRFGHHIRSHIANTVASEADVEDEVRYLIRVLGATTGD